MKYPKVCLSLLLLLSVPAGTLFAAASGKKEYLANCARCHGGDGKGDVPEMTAVKGYRSVDLTKLKKHNAGVFPRDFVYEAIEGDKRFSAHFIGDMPRWGRRFRAEAEPGHDEAQVKRKISDLVDYIESIQAN